ncbi:hypothetical protein ES703_62095 [subsurface metagenome]
MAALDHAYPNGRYLDPNTFITPKDPAVQAVGASIISKLGDQDSLDARLREAYNYVSLNIKYVLDKTQFGLPEVWMMPSETLKRGIGDCEDSSFLLCSLLLALSVPARVVFGVHKGSGHAWVEAWIDGTGGILETTSDQPFTGFADPSGYGVDRTFGDLQKEDPFMAFLVYIAPGLGLFAIGAFLMLDDAQDAFKIVSTYGKEPGQHGVLKGVAIPGLGPHIHHWMIGLFLVIISIIILVLGVVLWMLKFL